VQGGKRSSSVRQFRFCHACRSGRFRPWKCRPARVLAGGMFDRFTFFNDLDRYTTRVLVTDHEWNRPGNKLVVQAMPNAAGADAEVWLVELPRAY